MVYEELYIEEITEYSNK